MPGPPHARSLFTARALGSLTVRDPSDEAACLRLHLAEALFAPLLGPGSLSARRSFTRYNISPAALSRAEDVAAAAGLDFSPAPLDEFVARIHALRIPLSPSLLLDDDDFIANEAQRTAPPVKHRYMLGGDDTSIDAASSTPRTRSRDSAPSRACAGRATP